jgi:hypothetical protein
MTTSPDKLLSIARESGGIFENWMTNPPKLRFVVFPPDALASFAKNIHAEMSAEDLAILEAVRREMDEDDDGNAPGHAHEIPGIWDSDNGAKAGKPCAWCLTWRKFTALIERERIRSISTTESKGERDGD